MGRLIGILLVLHVSLFAGAYEENCIACHEKMEVGIDKFFYRYLLVFSSEISVKAALKDYLQHPLKEKTLLPEGLVARFGIKEATVLSDEALDEALETYWKTYSLIGRLQ